MTTYIKRGVIGIDKLTPEAAEGLRCVERLFARHGRDLTLTCGEEGDHMMGSYHYSHRAWDQRHDKVVTADLIRQDLNSCPKHGENSDFDVVDKKRDGTPKPCVHIEFDPK